MTTIQKKTACTRDCPDACGLIATIEDGRVVRLQGDPDHPVTRGFICQRTSRFPDRQYAADRLLKPLIRPRKGAPFQEADWTTALDLIAEKMLQFRSESGPESILDYRCGGSLGIMKHVTSHFFAQFGPVTTKSGDVCAGAGEAAQMTDFGDFDSNDFFDLQHSNTIVLWGKNIYASSVHLLPDLKQARARGARVILIDPVHHRTTSLADTYLQPRPGTDGAIALGIAAWLFEHDHMDANAATYCDHFDEFRQLALSRSVAEWAAIADVTESDLNEIAAAYSNGPTCSLIGWGLQRRRFGAATVRLIDALASVSGNVGIAGGGASFYFVRRGAFDFSFTEDMPNARQLPEPLLGQEILQATDPPIRMAYVWAANPVAMLPDSETVAEALRSREFTVVVDPFLTDSAQCADVVLPTTTMLEEDDLVGAYGHHYLGNVRPVVDAPPGVLSDYQIMRELARRVGLAEEFDVEASVWKDRLMQRLQPSGAATELTTAGFVRNPFVKDVLFADRKFPTASGRVNLIHQLHPEMFAAEPSNDLRVTAVSTAKCQGSQWMPEQQQGPADAVIHPSAAGNHQDGDIVEVRTRRGTLQVRLKFDSRQRTDVLLMEKGGWHSTGRSANALVEAELTDDGECAVYYDTPAELA